LRCHLVESGYFEEFTDYLDLVVRERGRPRRNLANSEDFHRFRQAPRSATALEAMLMTLKWAHPEFFARVCARELSPRQAAIMAGIVPSNKSTNRTFGVLDFTAATCLNPAAQGKLLCRFFKVLPVDAQCALLSRVIEPRLGPGLATRWRGSPAGA
jgi:hypothetical protein